MYEEDGTPVHVIVLNDGRTIDMNGYEVIGIRYLCANCIDWIKQVEPLMYDDYFIISHRFFIHFDYVKRTIQKYQISSVENQKYQVIARMTTEGDLDLKSPEWN